ncbi:MAG: glycosyltransferase family 4 protein [bacterium]|nr:glycosyltransferase family 4 protein [bacterium]
MRVAFVHSGYSRHLMSGIIRVETELVLALQKKGHVAEIMQWDEDEHKALVQQQYRRIVRPASSVYRQVRDFIAAGQYDLVVFQGVGYPETRALPWLKRETEARFVVVQHGWPLYSPATRLLVNGYMQTIGQALLAEADAVVAVSNYVKSHLSSFVTPDKIEVIYPGVDTTRFVPSKAKAELRQRYAIRQPYALLANGKLAAHKNIATLLRALPGLPDSELLLVGRGSDTKEKLYQEMARSLRVANRVRFMGSLPNEQLPALYNAVDLLVHPSKSESLGIVLLEALACETPVVAAAVGGIPELVTSNFNGTLYHDPKDVTALTRAIRALLDQPQQRSELGKNGRAFVKARFDWSAIIDQYLSLFERLQARPRIAQPQETGVFGAFA